MINNRLQGFLLGMALAKLVLMPAWFMLLVVAAAEAVGLMRYDQVAFETYLLGIITCFLFRMYHRPSGLPNGPIRNYWIASVRQANADTLFLALFLFAIIYATKDKAISRQFIGTYLASSWILLLLFHRFIPNPLARLFFQEHTQIRTVLVGSALRAARLQHWVSEQNVLGVNVAGLITFEAKDAKDSPVPVLGTIEDLETVLSSQDVHQVVLLENRNSPSWISYVTEICHEKGCRILIYNAWQDFFPQPMVAINDGGLTFFSLREEPLQNPLNRIAKRLLDIVVSLPVCLLVLPPLALMVWLFHRIQSPGPLLFKQKRTGAEMRPFMIYKFRTMHLNNPDEARQARSDDPRIFAFGAFLRRTSLDEFPQFLNVLTGRMSVVGPRPHLIAHDEAFARQLEIYRDRHFAKPGITGLAQNRGWRGEIRTIEEIENRISLDLHYIYNWSLWLDLGIICKTFWQIFFPPPRAY